MKKNLGSIIRLKRLEKNMKQEELADGICTTSYLSRIENNHLIPNEDIFRMLFERLDLDFDNIVNKNAQVNEKIEKWYEGMVLKRETIDEIEELRMLSESSGGEISVKFKIVFVRHLLMKGKLDQAEEILENLKKVIQPEYNRNFFLFTNVLMIYYHSKGNSLKAVKTALSLLDVNGFELLGKEYELGILYYNLALNYKNLYLNDRSIHFAKLALSIFNEGYYLNFALNCHIILGICYNNLGKWANSIKYHSLAKRVLTFLPTEIHGKILGIINNNLGFCYESQGIYDEAITHYLDSLNYKDKQERLVTVINLIRCYYLLKDHQTAKQWLLLGLEYKAEDTPKVYTLQLDIFSLILLNKDHTLQEIEDIQTESIDYFTSKLMWDITVIYCKIFARLYEEHNSYKKANKMYRIALKANEELTRSE